MLDHADYIDMWNNKYTNLVSRPQSTSDIVNSLMAEWCEELLLKAKSAYYKTDKPIMEDKTYDWFEDRLRIIRPNSNVLSKVGT